MKKKIKSYNKFRVFSGVSATLFAFLIGGNTVANAYSTWMNSALNTPEQKMVTDSGETPYYFTSNYDSLTDLLEARSALLEEISAEGSTLLKNENHITWGGFLWYGKWWHDWFFNDSWRNSDGCFSYRRINRCRI